MVLSDFSELSLSTESAWVVDFVDLLVVDFLLVVAAHAHDELDDAQRSLVLLQGLAELPLPVELVPFPSLFQVLVQGSQELVGRQSDRLLRLELPLVVPLPIGAGDDSEHQVLRLVLGHPAFVHHLLRGVKQLENFLVVRPLAEIVVRVVAKGVYHPSKDSVLEEGRDVLLGVVVRAQNLVLKLGVLGFARKTRRFLELLLLVLLEKNFILGTLGKFFEALLLVVPRLG